MRVKKIFQSVIFRRSLLLTALLYSFVAHAQYNCKDSLVSITNAYNVGDWTQAKNSARNFLTAMQGKGAVLEDRDYCKNNINQFYTYLIQSYLRLYNLDSATYYYFDALMNEVKVDLDPQDEEIFTKRATLKRHSLNIYEGVLSADIRELKFAISYGLSSRLFVEASYNQRHVNQTSDDDFGFMGKAVKRDKTQFPGYRVSLAGYDRYLELASFIKTPILKNQKDVNVFYFSVGVFMSYYLNSAVDTWHLIRYDDANHSNEAYFGQVKNQHYTRIDTLGMQMDLKRLYHDRFNVGVFGNIGTSIRMRRNWELFFELKAALGRNNRFENNYFRTFRPGVDYFFIVFGATKKLYRLKQRK